MAHVDETRTVAVSAKLRGNYMNALLWIVADMNIHALIKQLHCN